MLSFEYSLALLFFGIGGKVQFHSNPKEDIKLLSKPELSKTKILELSDIVLKITMINMYRTLNKKLDNMKAQMDDLSREKSWKLRRVIKMNNIFH